MDSKRRCAIIFRTFVTGLSINPSPRLPSTAFVLTLAMDALSRSVDFIEPNKPEPVAIDWNIKML